MTPHTLIPRQTLWRFLWCWFSHGKHLFLHRQTEQTTIGPAVWTTFEKSCFRCGARDYYIVETPR